MLYADTRFEIENDNPEYEARLFLNGAQTSEDLCTISLTQRSSYPDEHVSIDLDIDEVSHLIDCLDRIKRNMKP